MDSAVCGTPSIATEKTGRNKAKEAAWAAQKYRNFGANLAWKATKIWP
jgi:hypothetical protein